MLKKKINEAKNEFPRKVQLIGLKNRNGKSYFQCDINFYPQFNYFEEADIKSNVFTGRRNLQNSFDTELPF